MYIIIENYIYLAGETRQENYLSWQYISMY